VSITGAACCPRLPQVTEQPAQGDPAAPRVTGERRPATDAEARALASAVRLRILRLCLHEALTNKEIAARLERNPATVLHHVRTLVDTGFLIEQPVRRGVRGSREIPYLASGKSWYMDDGVPSSPGGGADLLLETFLQEVARLPEGALSSSRLGFRLNASDRDEVLGRLYAVLTEIADRPSDPDGESFGLYVGLHPEVD
jgi:DNA-binding transcriptional ArsR family regulator